ncbi:uncharacterized protein LOC110442055 isoform X2 [Mizuhopecten yessoensis]|uniref:Uncharacterized protein n=1 Tax=Mizuhopecten yessoensis TaxID=6573 RepID=A0A210PI42_MIZYE|nr:uncharacterized protein LOC110442055 isoform X2 [Mizuhopecten yessoensis]OWF36143.1 hypothetical protein KP79_PYT18971 [Mizuhopecten yessoensis]
MEKGLTLVYFNTQTTGYYEPSICELAAEVDAKGYQPFHKYILPTKPVEPQATAKNHFQRSPDGTQLLLKGEVVNACTLKDALKEFVKWLQGINNPVLVDHKISYHIKALNRAFADFPILGRQYEEAVKGTVDTLELFKMIYPPGTSLTREALVARILGEDFSYEKYTAQDHVGVLRKVIKRKGVTKAAILKLMELKPDTPRNPMAGNWLPEDMVGVDSTRRIVKRKRKSKEEIGKTREEIKRKKRESGEDSYNTLKPKKPCSPLERMSSADTPQWSMKLERKKQKRLQRIKKEKKRKKQKKEKDDPGNSNDDVDSPQRSAKKKRTKQDRIGKEIGKGGTLTKQTLYLESSVPGYL